METAVTIDLRHLGRGLDIPLRQIQAAVELLDEGNTVPFITRYRKDQTGGLDEEQIREIQGRLRVMRLLADRKQTILRSIESQGKLSEELRKRILAAATPKRLEDLYLPFKPKKMSLATLARSRGLEALAEEIFSASPACSDLDARAADFISVDRQVPTAADALLGAGHIIAERISEQAELRQKLREVVQRTGVLVSSRIQTETKPAAKEKKTIEEEKKERKADEADPTKEAPPTGRPPAEAEQVEPVVDQPVDQVVDAVQQSAGDGSTTAVPTNEESAEIVASTESETAAEPQADAPVEQTPASETAAAEGQPNPAEQKKLARQKAREAAKLKREQFKKKREEKLIKAFSDYFDYRESLRRIPPHRTLAINRGERAKILRVRIESDLQAMINILEEAVVPADHPHAEYLRGCARDSLSRLILPSLEREVRREATERAESHAVSVFAKNLRNLLLQPPVHDQRILAVDPGFRSGCKLAALDQFGNLLDHGVIHLVGKPDRREEAKKTVLDLIEKHQLTVIVIGNGTACRQTEDFIAQLIESELKDRGVAYVIVNEAGASVYSTSRVGREEFPDCDAVLRGAISIGRRLQDPLSELVKIDPANIGVGLYQHDVKAKHLRESLDEVVESCVNFVGVDANTASPALLRYVSGLNQLTARRLCEYRREHGPFKSRQQLREVPGLGEATFVQAAGFLKISRGENPLDTTWIHPESYETANGVVGRLLGEGADLGNKETVAALAEPIAKVELASLAGELGVGELTLKDILAQLVRPGRDPREDLPAPVFKRGVLNLEDLEVNMELTGTVLNVVDFGCFVDIGMHHSGLVHVSRLADKYVRDPHDVVAVGDIVKVWVLGIDKERQRVSLTMVRPGSERPKPSLRHHKAAAGGRAQPEKTDDRRPPRRKPEGERPRGKKPEDRRGPQSRGRRDQRHPPYRPRPRPKPLTPITEEMKTGKEPMRTFGDLLQFYRQKPAEADDQPPPAKEESPKPAPVETDPAPPVEQDTPAEEKPESLPSDPPTENPGVVAEESSEQPPSR
ncbi:MAG: helix-hairpin-helix domain-containing protein [Pirellulales bacterium]|nr:helix-hairpin-helix domain-containing protein [Pirellulales bacterium]